MSGFIKYGLVILMCLVFFYTAYFTGGVLNIPSTTSSYYFPDVKANADPWYSRVVTPGEMESTGWINTNTNQTDKFVADIFGAELIMGMTARVSTVGGDWANAPDPALAMADTDIIYKTNDPLKAYNLALRHNCSYIFVPARSTISGYAWEIGDHEKFNDPQYFELVYWNRDVSIYKVLA